MASLMVDFIISLDGYGAAEGWPGYWGMEGPEYLAWIEKDRNRPTSLSWVRRRTGSCPGSPRRCLMIRASPD